MLEAIFDKPITFEPIVAEPIAFEPPSASEATLFDPTAAVEPPTATDPKEVENENFVIFLFFF